MRLGILGSTRGTNLDAIIAAISEKKLAAEIEKRKAQFEKLAKEIIASMAGRERGLIKARLKKEGIPDEMIKELLPVEGAAAPGAEGAAAAPGAEGAAAPKEEAKGKEAKPAKEEKKK